MAVSSKSVRIGIIAEEKNDIEVIETLISKLVPSNSFKVKPRAAHGCGKLRRKCESWANLFFKNGCKVLIIVHDVDRNCPVDLKNKLRAKSGKFAEENYLILLPKEELEAWLLSDDQAIKRVFSIRSALKIPHHPETITSPKEYLERLIRDKSQSQYLNTVHNSRIARELDIKKLKKCASFREFSPFILKHFPKVSA